MPLESLATVVTTLVKFEQMLKDLGDDVNAKVNKLVESKLNAGLRALTMANNSSLPLPEILKLVEDARRFLLEAVDFEKNERLLVAYAALGTCCHILGDQNNLSTIIKTIDTIQYKKNYIKSTVQNHLTCHLINLTTFSTPPVTPKQIQVYEEVEFDNLKTQTLTYLKLLANV